MDELTLDDAVRFFNLNPALFCKANAEGRFLWVSPSWSRLLGYSEAQLLARPFLDYVHPEDLDATLAAMTRLNDGAPITDFVNRYRRADGEQLWLSWQTLAVDGVYYAVAIDVSESHRHRVSLEQNQRILQLAEEIGHIGHWRVDLVNEELVWSPQVYRIHGLSPTEHRPTLTNAVERYHPDDRARVAAHVQAAARDGQAFDFELRLIRADGVERDVVARGQAERDAEGEIVGIIGTFQDITERKRLQAQLTAAERMQSVSTLAAGVAHEINNPLQYGLASLSFAQETLASLPETEGTRQLASELEEALEGLGQVARIVQDLKLFLSARETSDGLVSMARALGSSLSMVRSELRQRTELQEDIRALPPIAGRYAELIQVFVNLLTNAGYAVRDLPARDARVRLSARTDEDGWAVVDVEDNGEGIPAEKLPYVFDPFFTTKAVGQGSGLGLHVSRGIVQRLGGDLSVTSEPGMTRFRVRLPPADEDVAETQRPCILVVDDDPRVGRTTVRMLERDYATELVHSGVAALRRVEEGARYAAIVSDIMMPEMNGWELLRSVASLDVALARRSVLVTGSAAQLHRPADAMDVPVLEKPFGPQALRDMVAAQLG